MENTQALRQRGKAFLLYPYLPKEIRLTIIKDAVEEAIQANPQNPTQHDASVTVQVANKPSPLVLLSGVSREWNRVIEMRLFNFITITASDLPAFEQYCSKRHGRLNKIRLAIENEEIETGVEPEYFVDNAISRLLNTMQHWDPRVRERQGLIEVQLDVSDIIALSAFNVSVGLGVLHHAPVVGALYEVPQPEGFPLLHPSSSLVLYRALPNVRHASLNLRRLDNVPISLTQARNDITSLGTIHPNLTHLELLADPHMTISNKRWGFWAPGTDCLAAFPPSWNNSLVRLDLRQVRGLPEFLTEAGRVAWLNLTTLTLVGDVESNGMGDQQLRAMNEDTCTALVRALTTLLPNTPKLTTVLIEMFDYARGRDFGSFRIQMCLGHMARGVEATLGLPCSFKPCSYKFVPAPDVGTVVVADTKVSGEVTTELQRAVLFHQRDLKGLVVFLQLNSSTWGRSQCRQWDPKKRSWEIVFENEADEIAYQMEQSLDLTES